MLQCLLFLSLFLTGSLLAYMAFFGKVRNILKQSMNRQITPQFSVSNPFIYQALRCMSSKVYVRGLPGTVDDNNLRETFAQYGEVLDGNTFTCLRPSADRRCTHLLLQIPDAPIVHSCGCFLEFPCEFCFSKTFFGVF